MEAVNEIIEAANNAIATARIVEGVISPQSYEAIIRDMVKRIAGLAGTNTVELTEIIAITLMSYVRITAVLTHSLAEVDQVQAEEVLNLVLRPEDNQS